ncbi:hypothetical protein DdX_02692 [Ditylenchus destructor]|uniref:Uncharacterized protein n=1 Tax=Ditylenchus destructor TaxID=166010 RepID=A0AAD4R9C9_9BILA|nr:hypothetical protein DdX_02692 [Ditylenchus destructor]
MVKINQKALLLFCISAVFLINGANGAVGKQKTINKIKAYLSTFITDSQLNKICDTISLDNFNGVDVGTMANNAINIVMNSLTLTQMMQGLKIIGALTTDFGSLDNAKAALAPVMDVAMNNLGPIFNQIQTKVKAMKAQGKGQTAAFQQQYKMLNAFLTQQRVQTILTRVKASLPASQWSLIVKDLGGAIFFSKYSL